jgi:formylglycine-generating enzyme required for sulfatase activity
MACDQVFISYSHADSEWLRRLQIMLAPLQRQGTLDVWADTRIQAGQIWKEEIEKALARAKVAVLLVSPDFLASDFIAKHELPPLLEAARKEGLTILWVPLRYSLYKVTDIARYQAAYDPRTPLSTLMAAQQDAALVQIAEALMAIKRSPSRPSPSPSPEPVRSDRVVLPAIKNIHGWLAKRVQALQQQTAQALGLPVEFSDELESGDQGPMMMVIPAGRFLMGSPKGELERRDDECQHEVQVAFFAIGKYAVTVGQFKRFVEAKGYRTEAEEGGGCYYWTGSEWKRDPDKNWRNPGFSQTDNHPVVSVSWNDAIAYAAWLSEQTSQLYRLPTEVEWEYACRAGTTTPFYFGETISTDQANYDGNYVYGKGRKGVFRQKTVEVGQFPANAWGLHDMHGNVWEWTCSVYDKDYGGGEQCCAEPGTSGPWVLRGGSWFHVPLWLRGAARFRFTPHFRHGYGGFRLART